ncbi:MAG: Mov34/MPN/PAD-1 family protein [Terriglobia bacterium]
MGAPVKVLSSVLDGMLEHACREAPAECCGLLAGSSSSQRVITEIFRAANALESRSEYFIAPQELIAALRKMRYLGLSHLGIYHSHPHSENFPSRRDLELAYYPSCSYFIIAPHKQPRCAIRAFEIRDGSVMELAIKVI